MPFARKHKRVSLAELYNVNNFVVYGSLSTLKWTREERYYLLESYARIYGRTPTTRKHWADVVRMANSTKPKEINKEAEKKLLKV